MNPTNFTPLASPLGSPIKTIRGRSTSPSKFLAQIDSLNLSSVFSSNKDNYRDAKLFKASPDIEFDSSKELMSQTREGSQKFINDELSNEAEDECDLEFDVNKNLNRSKHRISGNIDPDLCHRSDDFDKFGKENYNHSSPMRRAIVRSMGYDPQLSKDQVISKLKDSIYELMKVIKIDTFSDFVTDEVNEDLSQIQLIIRYYRLKNKINVKAEELKMINFQINLLLRNCCSLLHCYESNDEF